ncbi:MAG TPA: nitroreductase/quinone reductase family protein [Acidimicrobiales bacterium]
MDDAVRHALENDLTVDITTTGRRSGEPRRIEIWMLGIDGRLFITGTVGQRDWLANLRADPHLTVHLKQRVKADVPCVAREVTDEATRRMVLEHIAADWYRDQEPLDDLLALAPMVELTVVEP